MVKNQIQNGSPRNGNAP